MAHLVTNFPSACIQFSGGGEAPQNPDTLQFWNSFQLLQWPHMLAAVTKPNLNSYKIPELPPQPFSCAVFNTRR